jgi:cytoskeletal protein CcmA (bactofilin family)
MFGKNSDKTENTGSKTINLFADGTVIKGDIKTNNDIRIDGVVEGLVYSDAKVVVGPSGKVLGDIMCQSADISGRVSGVIAVKELLFLKSTAWVDGDISTNKLVVEAGAKFNGNCSMGTKLTTNATTTAQQQPAKKLEEVAK